MIPPLVSIITPIYNRAELVSETIESVLAQTYTHWEMIIVDDGSTDNSWEIISAYAAKYSQIKVYKRDRDPKGAPTSRNIGIEKSNGEYLIFLDADDLLSENCIENRISNCESFNFTVSPTIVFNSKNTEKFHWNIDSQTNDLERFIGFDMPWSTTSVFWERQTILKLNGFDENLVSFQDWDISVRALIQGFRYKKLSTPDSYWRMPDGETIGKKSLTIQHLDSHLYLLQKTSNMLINNDLMSVNRKNSISGLYFWLVNQWLTKNNKKEAYKVWKRCWETNLIHTIIYIEGLIFIFTKGIRILQGISRRWVYWRWNTLILNKFSDTFRSIVYNS